MWRNSKLSKRVMVSIACLLMILSFTAGTVMNGHLSLGVNFAEAKTSGRDR